MIVAGGRGMRLGGVSVAGDLPKVLVPAQGGKPVLQHQLELALAAGIDEVTIFAGHLAEKILAFIGDDLKRFGLRVRIFTEKEPMGTAGALLQCSRFSAGTLLCRVRRPHVRGGPADESRNAISIERLTLPC